MTIAAFLSIVLLHLMGAISLDPAIVMTVRTAAVEGLRPAIFAAASERFPGRWRPSLGFRSCSNSALQDFLPSRRHALTARFVATSSRPQKSKRLCKKL